MKSIKNKRQEISTGQLIKYVMDSIEKEEKLNMGATGVKKMLSFKEKFLLLRDFLNLRANPHKNRMFQQMKERVADNIKREEALVAADERIKKLARLNQKSNIADDFVTAKNSQFSVASSPSKISPSRSLLLNQS